MEKKTDSEAYRKIHFAVMAIESGAEKLNISDNESILTIIFLKTFFFTSFSS